MMRPVCARALLDRWSAVPSLAGARRPALCTGKLTDCSRILGGSMPTPAARASRAYRNALRVEAMTNCHRLRQDSLIKASRRGLACRRVRGRRQASCLRRRVGAAPLRSRIAGVHDASRRLKASCTPAIRLKASCTPAIRVRTVMLGTRPQKLEGAVVAIRAGKRVCGGCALSPSLSGTCDGMGQQH